jgi:hypothetical protein
MVGHPFIHMEIARQRHRELLLEADRRRLADRARPRRVAKRELMHASRRQVAERTAFTVREERT